MASEPFGGGRRVPSRWKISYSNITAAAAGKRLGFRIAHLYSRMVPVQHMLDNSALEGLGAETISKTKETIYDNLVRHILVEGYPAEGNEDFGERNVNDLVYAMIIPILSDFIRCQVGNQVGRKRDVQLRREKVIVSTDGETGGKEEFVVVDLISVTEEKFLLIIEAKRPSLENAMKQCLLAMKDAGDNNSEGKVYGFVTTGESWRMLSYDGRDFGVTRKFELLFEGMDQDKELWMKDYSALVECMYFALKTA